MRKSPRTLWLWEAWAHCPYHQTLIRFTMCQLGPLEPNSGCLPSHSVCAGSFVPGQRSWVWSYSYCLLPSMTLDKGLNFLPAPSAHWK